MKLRLLPSLTCILVVALLALVMPLAGRDGRAGAQTAASSLPNGVAAGDVTQSSAVLWAHSTAPGPVTFEVASDSDFANMVATHTAEVTDSMVPVKVLVEGLAPGTAYVYRVTDAAGTSLIGRFRTPAASGTHAGLRFGVSGDWRGELSPYPAIANADERELDFFIALGDTIYADYPSPDVPLDQAVTLEDFRAKHNEVYSGRGGLNTWADLRGVTALLATIDDHEVANDFAGGAAPASDERFAAYAGQFINDTELYQTGMQAFLDYNPLRDEVYGDTGDPRTAGKPRLYRSVAYGSDAAVFVLDARSFRDQELAPVEDYTDRTQALRFLAYAYDPARTMLGGAQLEALKNDLLQAQQDGITWKFVIMPEPIQNLGLVGASDRYEGYAAERSALLAFIHDNEIANVVFISADIHGSLVNNLAYQTSPLTAPIPVNSFEITTGPVAYDSPFGPFVFTLAAQLGFLTPEQVTEYEALSPTEKDAYLEELANAQITPLNYSPMGLDDSGLDVTLIQGSYVVTHAYGWTEFEIDAATQQLRITIYGIDWYSQADLEADPGAVAARVPTVWSEFTVNPQ